MLNPKKRTIMNAVTETKIVSGTYEIKVKTPMGVEAGKLTLVAEENSLSGTLENKKGSTEFSDGTVNGNKVEFKTKIKTPLGKLKAEVSGRVDAGVFKGTAKLPLGTAEIAGKKNQ